MEYIHVQGNEDAITNELSEVLSIDSVKKLLNHISEAQIYLDMDEKFEENFHFPSMPDAANGFVIPHTDYFINLKKATIVILAFIFDLKIQMGVLSTAFALAGFSHQALVKLNKHNGEKCMVLEAIKSKDKSITIKSILRNNEQCPNKHLNCKYCIDNKCTIKEMEVSNLLSTLSIKNVFKMSDEKFSLNW